MTLSLALFDPSKGIYSYTQCDELDGRAAAGFEDYRSRLWGSLPMRRRTYRFFPVLRNADLFVFPHEFDNFKLENASRGKTLRGGQARMALTSP